VIVFNPNLNDDFEEPPSILRKYMLTMEKLNLRHPEKVPIRRTLLWSHPFVSIIDGSL